MWYSGLKAKMPTLSCSVLGSSLARDVSCLSLSPSSVHCLQWRLKMPERKYSRTHRQSATHLINFLLFSLFICSLSASFFFCLSLRWGPAQLLKTQIRTMTTPPTASSCTWMWGTKCVYSWTGAKFTAETPTNTAPSLASSSTLTDSIFTFIYSLSVIKQKVPSPFCI